MGSLPDLHRKSSSSFKTYFHENFHSSKIELDLEVFEHHVLKEGHNLRDDSSCSSSESHASEPTEFSSCDRIDGIISNASKDLDRLTNEIPCLDFKEQDFTSEHKDIFDHILVEPLPQLNMKPYFFREKTKPEANHLPLKKRFVWKGDSTTTITKCATPASKCAIDSEQVKQF